MTLTVLTVVIIALMIAGLTIFLFSLGVLLNRTADNLDDCAQNVKNIAYQAEAIGPGIARINETGTTVLGALPMLCDGAESVAVAKGAPYGDPATVPPAAAPVATPSMVSAMTPSAIPPRGVGYLDRESGSSGYPDGEKGGLGYLDA